jgi:hypothetical protein
MYKKVLLSCALLFASAAYAEEEIILGSGCYTQSAMKDIVDLTGDDPMVLDDGMLLTTQYLKDSKCAPTVTTIDDWNAGVEIRDTGVKAVYAAIFNWAGVEEIPPQLPPKQVMYFDAKAVVTAE